VNPATCGILRLLKNVDKASPQLVTSVILGRHHNNAVLSSTTNQGLVNFTMRLTNVIVLSVNISDSAGVPAATEEVTLQAESFRLEVSAQDPTGKPTGPVVTTVDCVRLRAS
jgi:type VI protein secretion system component Hcp